MKGSVPPTEKYPQLRSDGSGIPSLLTRKRVLLSAAIALMLPFFACSTSSGSTSGGSLVISEVMSSNTITLSSEALGTPDWIELYNGSGEAIDLEGYCLTNNAKKLRKFTFPAVSIAPGEYLLVYACSNAENVPEGTLVAEFNISKGGETLIFTDPYAGLVQQLDIPALLGDVSYSRTDSGTYGFTLAPTPGKANDAEEICASLDDLLGSDAGGLQLSELVPYPTEGFAWAELYNASNTAIELNNYYISDRPAEPLRCRLPKYSLEPGAYVLVYFSDAEESTAAQLFADFKIGGSDATLLLSGTEGTLVSSLNWSANFPADLAVVNSADASCAAAPTPLAANTAEAWQISEPAAMDASDPVVISEVMPVNNGLFPDSTGECSEWVELYNRSSQSVNLRGYYLSDDMDAPARYALPDLELPTGGYLVVCLSGKNTSSGELHANFRLSEGETLVLTCMDGMRQDSILYDSACPLNASYCHDATGALLYYGTPTPGYANAKAYTLPNQVGWFDSGGVFISEVCAIAEGQGSDWIELCNNSNTSVSLDGWHLSDDTANPTKYRLSGITISAGGYAVIEASGDGSADGAAPFGVSGGGETLVLSEPSGRPCDLFETGKLRTGMTSGRLTSSETVSRVFFSEPTRGAANNAQTVSGYTAVPSFDTAELYHDAPFAVSIRCATSGAEIRYTTDGSEPDERSALYTEPFEVSDNTVIRAAAFCEGLFDSDCASTTYLFTEPHTVPVVCVAADPDSLKAVLKTSKREDKPECSAEFTLFDETGAYAVSFSAGIRAKGRSMLKYSQKSFSVKLRGEYGQSCVPYPFFENSDIVTFSAFSLRSGGQDRGRSRLRDSYFSRLAEGLQVENFSTRVVALYLNGEYYGVFDLNEEQDESYLASHYSVDENAVDIVNRNDEVKEGSAEDFLRVREFARTQDLSDDAIFAQFAEWVDIPYFTDYLVYRSYIADSDMINQAYWRSQNYAVKWRPILFDLDYGLFGNQYAQEYKKDILSRYFSEEGVPSADKSLTNMDIYVGLKKNASWRRAFVARYIELMHTTLSPEHMLALLDEMDDAYLAEMPRQIESIGFPSSINYMKTWLDQLRTGIEERPAYALEYLKENFPGEADYIDELLRQYE